MKDSSPAKIDPAVLRLFEAARARPGEHYDGDRFLAYLTQPPAPTGRRVADTFEGRRRFVRFMDSVQLELGVCFSNEEWERGFTLNDFMQRLEAKIAKPEAALRLARQRLQQARISLTDEPIKFGLLAIPLLVAAIVLHPIALRILLAALWAAIVGGVLIVNAAGYRYAKKLVRRIGAEAGPAAGTSQEV